MIKLCNIGGVKSAARNNARLAHALRRLRATIVAGMAAVLCVMQMPQSAQAQYFGYSPYSGTANWLWLARGLEYPLMRSSSYSAPYYLATPLIWNATYALSQGAYNSRRASYGQYADPSGEPLTSPRMRTRPYVNGGSVVQDQSVHANWIPPSRPWPCDPATAASQSVPAAGNSQNSANAPGNQWVPASPISSDPAPDVVPQVDPFAPQVTSGKNSPVPNMVADKVPPLAPPIKKSRARRRRFNRVATSSNKNAAEQQIASSGSPKTPYHGFSAPVQDNASRASAGSTSSPLARGFIQLVNENYHGDIVCALADADMRKYAHAIGLIPDQGRPVGELNSQRTALIRQILADESEDPAVRVSAVKMLLKQGSASQTATVSGSGI